MHADTMKSAGRVFAVLLTLSASARALEKDAVLEAARQIVRISTISGVASGRHEDVSVRLMGRTQKAKVERATDEAVVFASPRATVAMAWDEMDAGTACNLGVAYVPRDDGDAQMLLGAYCLANGLERKGDEAFARAAQSNGSLVEQVRRYRSAFAPPPPPKPSAIERETVERDRAAARRARTMKTRDPWLWPFSADSIWNTPIGSGAVYKPANLGAARHVGCDIQILVRTSNEYPEREVYDSPTWGPGRATGTQKLGFTLRVPDDWTVPDAGKGNPYGLTPNFNFAFLMPDGMNILTGCKVCRPTPGSPIYMPKWMAIKGNRRVVSLTSDGMQGGGQGASGMSSLGGTIRLGELASDRPIRHVIKINPWAAKYCYYSEEVPGWRWPARRADSYAAGKYRGPDPALVMGTLLALKPEATPRQLGIRTAPGLKLFFTLQNYGAYFTEDAAWDTWDLIVERDAEKEFERAHGFSMKSARWRDEVNGLMQALYIVDNNAPGRIGGGGRPRQPLAPPLRPAAVR